MSFQIPRSVVGGTTDCPTWRDKGVETVQLMLQGSRPLSTATILPAQGHHQLGSATAPWPPSAHHSMSLSSDDVPHKGRITVNFITVANFQNEHHTTHISLCGTTKQTGHELAKPAVHLWELHNSLNEHFMNHLTADPECLRLWGLGPMVKAFHYIQGDQKVSVHLMITIQKVTSNFQSVPRQSLDIYWHGLGDTRLTLTPSVIPNSNYVIMVGDWNGLKYIIFACFLYCNRQVHRDFLITLYYRVGGDGLLVEWILKGCTTVHRFLHKQNFPHSQPSKKF